MDFYECRKSPDGKTIYLINDTHIRRAKLRLDGGKHTRAMLLIDELPKDEAEKQLTLAPIRIDNTLCDIEEYLLRISEIGHALRIELNDMHQEMMNIKRRDNSI